MSGANHPIDVFKGRVLYVPEADLNEIVGRESYRIRILSYYQYRVGERVKVMARDAKTNEILPLWCLRYITQITPVMALLLDEDICDFELNAFNEASF